MSKLEPTNEASAMQREFSAIAEQGGGTTTVEQLIQQYCPDGVEYVSIGNLITRVRNKGGKNPTIKTVYSVSNTLGLVKAEDFRENVIYSEDTSNYVVIEQGMFAYNPARLNIGSLAWLQSNQSGLVSPMYVVFSIDQTKVLPEFLFLHLKSPFVIGKINSLTESGARFRFDFERWKLIEIPIPPVPIQREVVRLLDTFSELQSTLQIELQKRLQQYNYYRDNLLSFEGRTDVEWKKLGEIGRISSGKNKQKKKEGSYPVYGSTGIIAYCDEFKYDNPLILVARVGANAGFTHVASGQYDVSDNTLIIDLDKKDVIQKYIFYILVSINLNRYAKGGGQPLITAGEIKEITIPIPSLTEQQRIVDILDRFDTLTTDITAGLPAEIEARRKQYEYYRDKLLTFKQKG